MIARSHSIERHVRAIRAVALDHGSGSAIFRVELARAASSLGALQMR